MLKIAIIGGGICGFSCGVKIAEYFQNSATVTIISDHFTPNTTGDISAGLWGPYLCGDTSEQDVIRWSKATHDFLRDLWTTNEAGRAGVCLMPCIRTTTCPNGLDDFWKNIVYGFNRFSSDQLTKLNMELNKNFTDAVQFVTFTSEPLKLLPYLMRRFEQAGGSIINRKIDSLQKFVDTADFDVIVNCTGLGAKDFVPDKSMQAIRGQVIRVKAPWMYYVLLDESDDGNYIIPNSESVVLGGTHQVDDYNTTPNRSDRQFILSGCQTLVPGMVRAPEIQELVGLRPGRNSVRLEKEIAANGKLIVHNYGHGGSGVTLAWGCASDVLDLIKNNNHRNKL